MKITYEKQYTWKGIRYTVKARKALAIRNRAILELYDQYRIAPLWSDIVPLANMESLADHFFSRYQNECSYEEADYS